MSNSIAFRQLSLHVVSRTRCGDINKSADYPAKRTRKFEPRSLTLARMTRRLFDYIFLVVVAPFILAAASGRILGLLHDYYLTAIPDDDMEKPLPNLPNPGGRSRKPTSNLALTIEARAHLHRLVSRALDEEGDLRDRETWAEKVEASLDDLGASLARGGWLPGLRRGRCVRRQHHEEAEKRRSEERAKKDKEAEEQARNRTAKGRSKLKDAIVEDKHAEDERSDEQRTVSLEQLRDAASKPFLPTPKPSVKHLLLTVAGSPTSEPAEDLGFKLVRSAVHCSFKPGEFVIPTSISPETTDATILYGLDDWDGECVSVFSSQSAGRGAGTGGGLSPPSRIPRANLSDYEVRRACTIMRWICQRTACVAKSP